VTAHALTTLRLLLVAPFAWWLTLDGRLWAWLAAGAIGVAIATDLLDGIAARRAGTESAAGRLFDHAADFLFVTSGLFALAWRGATPWILPVLIAVAFTQYVVDSYWLHRERQLRMSRLGRWNGILYFVPLCGDVLARLGLPLLHGPVRWIAWALVVTTLLSIGDRLLAINRSRTAPGSPA
jgi:phosphatidylglycerophosphate synthase